MFIDKTAHLETRPGEMQLYTNKCLFGEEFEFYPGGKPLLSKKLHHYLERWKKELETIACESGISNLSIKMDDETLFCQLGYWEYKVFKDSGTLEVNTTPYHPEQCFSVRIHGKESKFTAYQLFDLLIHPVARKLECTGRSGHKHVDVSQLLSGNPELLLRIFMDMENIPWLARALGRESRRMCFLRMSDSPDDRVKLLSRIIEETNKNIKDPMVICFGSNFSDLINFRNFLMHLGFLSHGPCNLSHLQDKEYSATIHTKPMSTIEFRVFHCPENGEESSLINRLLLARIRFHLQCQKERRPIPCNVEKSDSYDSGRDEEVVTAYHQYISECGLDPGEFRKLLRIPVPESCHHLF